MTVDFDLTLLDMTPEKILNQIKRATRARYRYVFSTSDAGRKTDIVVDHQLVNHILLLETLAGLAGVDVDSVNEAARVGIALAQGER